MRNQSTKKTISMFLALFVAISSLASLTAFSAARSASARGEAEVEDTSSSSSSSSSSLSSSDSSSSGSTSSKKSSTTKKVEDRTATGTFSTPTDSRKGATKPEDNVAGVDNRGGATAVEDNGIDNNQGIDDRNGATKVEDNGGAIENRQLQGEDSVVHRSVVAGIVEQLKSLADREGGIGAEVRIVAQQQNDSKERALAAIDKVEKRGKVTTFLFGVDTKNLAELRNEKELTRRNEAEIRKAAQKVENVDNKNVLLKQADMLKKEGERLEKIEAAHSEAFSLFGWVKNIFSK